MATDDEIKRLSVLFEGCASASGTHGTPYQNPGNPLKWSIQKVAKTDRWPPTFALWKKHVMGERPLGVIPIREDSTCSWGSADYDVYDTDLLAIIERVEAMRLPLVPCRSKSGGLHLFLFLLAPESAESVQAILSDCAAALGLAGCEIFPKQVKILIERGDVGNWMIAPYFGGDFDGKLKMQYGIKRTGAEMTLGEFLTIAEERRTTTEAVTKILEIRKTTNSNVVKLKTKGVNGHAKNDFSNGPPCLEHLVATGPLKDGRKTTLFMQAIYYKKCDNKHWQSQVEAANQLFNSPPLPSEEVAGIIRSIGKKDYEYTCKKEPMCSHCNVILCRMRKFGVGRDGDYPRISSISKLDAEPTMWFVDVVGARLELNTDQLQSYVKFHAACLDAGSGYQMVTQKAWMSTIAVAMDNLTIIPAPPDVGRGARFRELLDDFLGNRREGDRAEDLLSGRPWHDVTEGKHYFTLNSFQKFLSHESARDMMNRGQIINKVKDSGGDMYCFKFENNRCVHCWWIPSSMIQVTRELKTPPINKEEI